MPNSHCSTDRGAFLQTKSFKKVESLDMSCELLNILETPNPTGLRSTIKLSSDIDINLILIEYDLT